MPTAPQQPPSLCPAVTRPCRGDEEPGRACPPGTARPLPDPAAVRLWRVPESAPPYDPPDSRGIVVSEVAPGPQAQPAATPEPDPQTRASSAPDSGPQTRPGAAPDSGPPTGRPQTRPGTAPDSGPPTGPSAQHSPPDWPSHFAQVLVETLAGSRPARQIVPWTTERARTHIRRLGSQLSAGQQQPRVRRVMTFRPACDVVEMTVVVKFGPRVRALAVRLERADPGGPGVPGQPARTARWLCTAVEAA